MAMYVGPTSDYTQLVKEYIPRGQKQTLWEQFLTGTQETFQNVAQQTQDVYAYDISEAYANYKKQQLQLQMSEQLGSGFQQQVGKQLQTEYGTAFQDIKTKEAGALTDVSQQYVEALETGAEQFAQVGANLKRFEELVLEYAENTGMAAPEDAYQVTVENGITTTSLTDAGRLWYYDVINSTSPTGETFDKWLLGDESLSKTERAEREALYESYRQNPELYRYAVAGLTEDFDIEKTRTTVNTARARKNAPQYVNNIADRINFDWDDSFMIFGGQPFAFDSKYVDDNVDALKEYYVAMGINPIYAKEDLTTVMNQMKQWFNDTGTHKASTQKNQYKKYLTAAVNARLKV